MTVSFGGNLVLTDLESKLIEFALNVAEDAALELFSLGEDLFHCHAGYEHTSLTLDDTLDDVFEVLSRVGLPLIRVRKKHGIFHQRISAVFIGCVLGGSMMC